MKYTVGVSLFYEWILLELSYCLETIGVLTKLMYCCERKKEEYEVCGDLL